MVVARILSYRFKELAMPGSMSLFVKSGVGVRVSEATKDTFGLGMHFECHVPKLPVQ